MTSIAQSRKNGSSWSSMAGRTMSRYERQWLSFGVLSNRVRLQTLSSLRIFAERKSCSSVYEYCCAPYVGVTLIFRSGISGQPTLKGKLA